MQHEPLPLEGQAPGQPSSAHTAGPVVSPVNARVRPAVVVLVVLLVLGVWFGTLGIRHLIGPDEGRYAEIAREMFASGDWVTVRYNDLKYFEKPPFHMWVTALAYTLFGIGEWQARLVVALSGFAGMIVTMLAAARWYGARAGWLAGLVLLAAPMWSVASHFNTLDITLSGAMAGVLAFMLLAQHPRATPAARRGWMLACWAAMGVAILTKGLVGLALPGLVLVVYTLVARDFALWRRLHLLGGVAVMLAVTVPWFWLVAERNPEFLQFFFIQEHWQRYTSNMHSRSGPLLYFVPLLLAGFLPWIGLLPRMWAAMRVPAGEGTPFRPALLAGIWAIAIFVFFSLSRSKLPGYIVPIFPALAILAAVALNRIDVRAWRRQLVAMAIVMTCGLLASPIVATLKANHIPNEFYRLFAVWVAAAFALMLVGVLLAGWLLRRRGLMPSIMCYAVSLFVGFSLALLGHQTVGRPASGADIAPQIARVLTPEMPLYGVRMLDHTLPFYLGHPLRMVEGPDELAFGTRMEPERWIPDLAGFATAWRNGKPALAVMSPDTYRDLSGQLAMHVVARDWRRVVVANFPPDASVPAGR